MRVRATDLAIGVVGLSSSGVSSSPEGLSKELAQPAHWNGWIVVGR